MICNKIVGLTAGQRRICAAAPDAMAAVGHGIRMAKQECQQQFSTHRWNCTGPSKGNPFGHLQITGKLYNICIICMCVCGCFSFSQEVDHTIDVLCVRPKVVCLDYRCRTFWGHYNKHIYLDVNDNIYLTHNTRYNVRDVRLYFIGRNQFSSKCIQNINNMLCN